MPHYPAGVHWLLQSYATEVVIAAAYQKVLTARQTVDEDETQFATRLNQYAADAGSVFSADALITAYLDGLLPYVSNTVRGHVTSKMTFAEVRLLAVQAGTAARSLNSLSKVTSRVGPIAHHAPRVRPVVAATAGSYRRDAEMYADRGVMVPSSEEIVAAAEYQGGAESLTDHSDSHSLSSLPSSISAPSRDWVSASATPRSVPAVKESTCAVDYRTRGCHLCFHPQHFLMDCPLLSTEARQLAQQQRDQKARDSPVRRDYPAYPRNGPRPPIAPRVPEPRRMDVSVNPVVEERPPVAEDPVQPELPSEN
jgi:hypothetical protein